MQIHVVAGILVGLVGSGIALGLAEKVTLIFCVLLVLFAEILNSALEQLVDLAIQQFDEKAKLAKDAAAAGVLLLAIGTVVIFAAVLVHNAPVLTQSTPQIARQLSFGLPLTLCAGGLVWNGPKPRWLDAGLTVSSLGLWACTISWSQSYVFSALTGGLLLVCAAAARARMLHKN